LQRVLTVAAAPSGKIDIPGDLVGIVGGRRVNWETVLTKFSDRLPLCSPGNKPWNPERLRGVSVRKNKRVRKTALEDADSTENAELELEELQMAVKDTTGLCVGKRYWTKRGDVTISEV
jgi:hypothetical protein